jgi:hypothetical protein
MTTNRGNTDWTGGAWRTSSYSNGNSGQTQTCVQLATDRDRAAVGVRDSKQPTAGHLVLPDVARASLLAFARTDR